GAAGEVCGTAAREVWASHTHAALPGPSLMGGPAVTTIVGVESHVTATRNESVSSVSVKLGPRTNSASPAAGGVKLSRSAGRKPYYATRSWFCMRAGRPAIIFVRSKT